LEEVIEAIPIFEDEDDNKAQDFEALKEELMNEKLELE